MTKFLGGVAHGPGTNELDFGDDPDHRPDPGVRSPKSGFTRLSNYQRILQRAGVWPRDQLITFWWRSSSLSGSGSPFRITIRIREELPRCQYTQNRYPQCSPNEFNFDDDPDHRPDPGVRNPDSLDYRLCWRSAEVCAIWTLLVADCLCLLCIVIVGWFVRYACCDFSKSKSPIFMILLYVRARFPSEPSMCYTLGLMSGMFSKFPWKFFRGQGQSSMWKLPYWRTSTCNSSASWPWFKIFLQIWEIWQIWSKFGVIYTTYDFRWSSRWQIVGDLHPMNNF